MAREPKSRKIIPAAPGFWLWSIDYDSDDGDALFCKVPIVAWCIEVHWTLDKSSTFITNQPLTAEASPAYESYAVEWPNGQVDLPEDTTFDSWKAANECLVNRRAQRIAAAQAKTDG